MNLGSIDQYVTAKQEQLKSWEAAAEKRAHDAVSTELAVFRTKRDDIKKKLDALKSETSDRVEVLRMGVDSAWEELKTAFETAIASNPNAATKKLNKVD